MRVKMKNRKLDFIFVAVLLCAVGVNYYWFSSTPGEVEFSSISQTENDLYHNKIQNVFDNRCVVCHSCNNAPCQLNLTSYAGFLRGATQTKVYHSKRLESIDPTRLGIDGKNLNEWRRKGFFSVIDPTHPAEGLLFQTLAHKSSNLKNTSIDPLPVLESHTCPSRVEDLHNMYKERPQAGMPYGLPALNPDEMGLLSQWIKMGAPGSNRKDLGLNEVEIESYQEWLKFLNDSQLETRLVARYLYEHLFLAHLYFSDQPQKFFRLVRSRSHCSKAINEIPTRRPNDDPGSNFYYCFKPVQQTIVEKTHLPYKVDAKKLAWMKNNFFGKKWRAKGFPSYEINKAANPFLTFEDIPVEARYRFLLEDAHYNVATFIKGPVCNGNNAVSSIDEQFYMFFMDPASDLMVKNKKFADNSKELLVVPAENGSDGGALDTVYYYFKRYSELREKYEQQKREALQEAYPKGYALENIWDGYGNNENAVLTVFRHKDNSYVVKGARGDSSYSTYVLDYALFERLVYNLVVGFDVYGDLSHQLHSRAYMGIIRMQAEDNYLDFFPFSLRKEIVHEWYERNKKAEYEKEFIGGVTIPTGHPTQVKLKDQLTTGQAKAQMHELFLAKRLPYMAQRFPDSINWKMLKFPVQKQTGNVLLPDLQKLSNFMGNGAPWIQYFPDSSLLVLKKNDQVTNVYTLIRNKKIKTIGTFLFAESKELRELEKDDLIVLDELATSYPNYFFIADEDKLPNFVKDLSAVRSSSNWSTFKYRWGLGRNRSDFWKQSDQIQAFLKAKMGIYGGVVDYTRYDVWTP